MPLSASRFDITFHRLFHPLARLRLLGDAVPWTAGQLLKVLGAIAEHAEHASRELLEVLTAKATADLAAAVAKHDAYRKEVEDFRSVRILPDTSSLEKVSRYEAGLERSLYKALHELQRLQGARIAGQPVVPPAAVDVDIAGLATAEA
jgi:hypothetical protein